MFDTHISTCINMQRCVWVEYMFVEHLRGMQDVSGSSPAWGSSYFSRKRGAVFRCRCLPLPCLYDRSIMYACVHVVHILEHKYACLWKLRVPMTLLVCCLATSNSTGIGTQPVVKHSISCEGIVWRSLSYPEGRLAETLLIGNFLDTLFFCVPLGFVDPRVMYMRVQWG